MKLFWIVVILAAINLSLAQFAPSGQFLSPASNVEQFEPFPKILWAFWATGLNNTKLWTKLCINNMYYYSRISGFQFRFLTDQNYTNYLSPESNKRFQAVLDGEKEGLKTQQKASILRGFLMYENGGIWADAHTILTSDFSWVENLYKYSGVYNRFHPNPEVVFFTKNKNYSGNKTRLYDQKRQQQVYLFPGMQNWFLISKPKSKFYTDLVKSFERYVKLGRQFILKDAKSKGIQFGGETYYYFKFGSFQLQLTLQSKQKQLDKMEGSHVKYAVEYYKMWNIHSEYSGFILLAHMNNAQQIAFHFQYEQQSLSKLYEFKVSTPFVKDIRTVTNDLQDSFTNSSTKSCHDVSNQLQKDSFVYKHLISIPSMFDEVNKLKNTYSFFEGKCNPLAQTIYYLDNSITILNILVPAILICLCVYSLMNNLGSKIRHEQKGYMMLTL